MKTKLTVFIVLALLSLSFSRLLTTKEVKKLAQRDAQLVQPHLAEPQNALGATSSANPVQGIANATSGYLSVSNTTNAKLFYIFYQCRGLKPNQNPNQVPIIIWLQGGPGSTSQLGNFYENGPYTLVYNQTTKTWTEKAIPLSWNDYYHMLFIDNPRGVGYSVSGGSYVTNEDQVASDLLNALLNFYQLAPFTKFVNTPLYIFGESYGGHYVPSFAQAVLQYNAKKPGFIIPLKGIGIGDGWTDPVNQLSNNDLFALSLGLVDMTGASKVKAYQAAGIAAIQAGNWGLAMTAFDNVINAIDSQDGGLNVYNFRLFGDYDFSPLVTFFNYKDTCNRYNVDPSVCGTFTEVNTQVYSALSNDFMQSVANRVAYVVEQIPVLLYNGQYDIIVNSPSAEAWINALSWSGKQGFYDAQFQSWMLNNGTVVGFKKSYKNLRFHLINKAGHLAPMDQMEATIDMINTFIGGH